MKMVYEELKVSMLHELRSVSTFQASNRLQKVCPVLLVLSESFKGDVHWQEEGRSGIIVLGRIVEGGIRDEEAFQIVIEGKSRMTGMVQVGLEIAKRFGTKCFHGVVPTFGQSGSPESIPAKWTDRVEEVWGLPERLPVASRITLRVVDRYGENIILPHESGIREEIEHAIVSSDLILCQGAMISHVSSIAHSIMIDSTTPEFGFCRISGDTHVSFFFNHGEVNDSIAKDALKLPALIQGAAYQKLRELLLWPTIYEKAFAENLCLRCPRGVLLHGEPGTGKTASISAIAQELSRICRFKLITVSPNSFNSETFGAVEEALRDSFSAAKKFLDESVERSRCIISMDGMDGFFAKRDGSSNPSKDNNRVVAQLLTLLDGAKSDIDDRLVLVASTNSPDFIDPALRRAGRFEVEIEFSPPERQDREDILVACIAKIWKRSLEEVRSHVNEFIEGFASSLVGFVGADIESMLSQTCLIGLNDTETKNLPNMDDLVSIKMKYGVPSLLRKQGRIRGASKKRQIHTVGGYEDIQLELRKALHWPIKHRQAMSRLKLHAPKGILMHGPPGCSKTTLARCVAQDTNHSFFYLGSSDVYSPFVGESERKIRVTFKNARLATPSVVFLDEIDTLVGRRGLSAKGQNNSGDEVQGRVLSTLLNEMDGIHSSSGVLVLAATNRLEMIDEALLRPGRFDRLISVPLPSYNDRVAILRIHTDGMPLQEPKEEMIETIARLTNQASGAKLEGLCREAGIHALRENKTVVSLSDFRIK